MTRRRVGHARAGVFAVCVIGALAVGTFAWGIWSATGDGAGASSVTALATPTGVSVPSSVMATTVTVSWTGVTAPSGASDVEYWVRRSNGSTSANACGTTQAAPLFEGAGAKSCDDTSVDPGSYSYIVTAVWRTWTAQGSTSGTVVVTAPDTTPPAGGAITANSAAAYNSTGIVALTVTNFTDGGSGIASNVITRASGTLSGGSCDALSGATVVSISGGNDPSTLSTGCYQYTLTGTDNASNVATTVSGTVKVDRTAPTLTVSVTGAAVLWNGTAIVYRPGGLSSAFVVTATDPESGISSVNFPAAPTGWTRTTGTNSATYTLGSASASSATLTGVSTTNAAGTTTSQNITITRDQTNPTSVYSLASASNAFLSGSTLYYRGNTTGSFNLVGTVADAGAGAYSVIFPSISTTGWTHNSETVTTPASGPFSSSAYSWNLNPTQPSSTTARTMIASDAVGNTTSTLLTFTSDTSASSPAVTFPVVSTSYNSTTFNAGCTSTICGTVTDAASGIATVEVSVRQGTGNYWNGTGFSSGSEVWTEATGTSSWSIAFSASNFVTAGDYTVSARMTDRVGNVSSTTSKTFTIDNTAPTVTSVTFTDADGQVEKDDTITIVFSEQMSVSSLCSTWSSDSDDYTISGNNVVVVTIRNGVSGANDSVASVTSTGCTFNFGTLNLGSTGYVAADRTFSGSGGGGKQSRIDWTSTTRTLVIKLGEASGTVGSSIPATTVTYTPSTSVKDSAGNAISGSYSFASRRF